MRQILKTEAYTVYADRFVEGRQQARVTDDGLQTADGKTIPLDTEGFPTVRSSSPLFDALYALSIRDHKRLVIDSDRYYYALCMKFFHSREIPEGIYPQGSVFWAGYGFNTLLYTRDVAYASWLGTAYPFPQAVRDHLMHVRNLRKNLGLKVSRDHTIPIAGIPTEVLDMDERDLKRRYNTNSYTRRTDDVVWVFGLWEVYKRTQDTALLQTMMDTFTYFDWHFYRYFLDEADGLYRGQATFIDPGGNGYPEYSNQESVMIKALSTNGLYVGAFDIMAQVSDLLNEVNRAEAYTARRASLSEAIRRAFGPHGYPYYIAPDGTPSDRRELLGTAFLALFDIILPEESRDLLESYPPGDFGRPQIWPPYEGKKIYHNHATWPFADVLFSRAQYKVCDKAAVIRDTFGRLARHSLQGNFCELMAYETGDFVGCPGYIWSAAAYLALVFKMVAGMNIEPSGWVSFAPVLPEALGNELHIEELTIGPMTLTLEVTGSGDKIAACRIDEESVDAPILDIKPGTHHIHVTLQ
jgi:hypothetical protein